MDVDPGSILSRLGKARRFADPSAPIEARLMAASGALPLPPPLVAQVLFALTFDAEAEVKDRARRSLEGLPAGVVDAVVSADVHPGVLALLADCHQGDEARLEKIALNPATSNDTLCFLAARPFSSVVDALAHNQTRLLECDALLEALGQNPLTGPATIERILEFLARERGEIPGAPAPEPASPEAEAHADPQAEVGEASPDGLPPELVEDWDADVDEAEREDRTRSLQSLISDMTVVEKVKLARFGNGEARGLLVRDYNRIVATAAIRSPKLQENEVATYARSRNLCEEVLRVISTSREWTRSYQVKHALVTNPKTPLSAAIKFVNYLTDRDLKMIMRSRDVPAPISQQARRILLRKGKL